MKFIRRMRILFILCLLTISHISVGQKLSFSQLLNLQKKDAADVSDFLLNLNWKYYNINEDNSSSTVTWNYPTQNWDSEKATSWLSIDYFDYGSPSWLRYQTSNINYFNSIKNSVTAIGMEKLDSFLYKGAVETVYGGKNYAAILSIFKTEAAAGGHLTSYEILLVPRDDYFSYLRPKRASSL